MDKTLQQNMLQAYKYIYKDSPKNALKVVEHIAELVYKAINNPEFIILISLK